MPTASGKTRNAICLRCRELDPDKLEEKAGWCTKYSVDKLELFVLHYCAGYFDCGEKEYEKRLQDITRAVVDR